MDAADRKGLDFSDLVQRADRLSTLAEPEVGSAPPVHCQTISEVLEEGKALFKKIVVTSVPDESVTKKSELALEAEGLAFPKSWKPAFEMAAPAEFGKTSTEGDVEEREPLNSLQTSVKSAREFHLSQFLADLFKEESEKARKRFWKECVVRDWEAQEEALLNWFPAGISALQNSRKASFKPAVPAAPAKMPTLHDAFSHEVIDYVQSILKGDGKVNLVTKFLDAVTAAGDEKGLKMWHQVEMLSDVPLPAGSSLYEQRTSSKFAAEFSRHALKFLEHQFLDHMMSTVCGRMEQSQRGGKPGTYHLVHAFLNVVMPVPYNGYEGVLIQNHPIWAVIFYCLRSGSLDAAVAAAEAGGPEMNEFLSVLTELKNGGFLLSPETEMKTVLNFRRASSSTNDVYKVAVCCAIALCDPQREHPEVTDRLEDWLWLKLRQVTISEEKLLAGNLKSTELPHASASQLLTLANLQQLISVNYGEAHFAEAQNPLVYWTALFMSGQFEAAISFMLRQTEDLRCHAVHIAIALYQMRLLLTPAVVQAELCTTDGISPLQRLSFTRLIHLYTSSFRLTYPEKAVYYYYLLRNFENAQKEDMFSASFRDLVLETNDFDLLLGSITSDGVHIPGLASNFKLNSLKLLEFVAADAEKRGCFETAAKVYDLAENNTKTLEILSDLLSEVACLKMTPGSRSERIIGMARDINERYLTRGSNATMESFSTFSHLLQLVTYFELYYSGSFAEAINVKLIKGLELLPFSSGEISSCVNKFYAMPDQMRKLLPEILMSLMDILLDSYRNLRNKRAFSASSSAESLADPKETAKALITYSGQIAYQFPGDVLFKLVQAEISMV